MPTEYLTSWSEVFLTSLYSMSNQIAAYIPKVIGALVLLVVGLIIANILSAVISRIIRFTRIESLADQVMSSRWPDNPSFKFKFSDLIGKVVKWFFYIVTFIAISDTLQIPEFTQFLVQISLYLPKVLIAIIIAAIGLVAGRFLYTAVSKALEPSMGAETSKILGAIADWAVIIFAGMAAVLQLGIAPSIIQILFGGLVLMISLAGGLAFGLGGKEQAANLLEKISREAPKNIPNKPIPQTM